MATESYTHAISKELIDIRENNRDTVNLSFYHTYRGLAYYHQGEMDEAKLDYDEAIKLNECNADNYFHRGNVFTNLQMFSEA